MALTNPLDKTKIGLILKGEKTVREEEEEEEEKKKMKGRSSSKAKLRYGN